jgi:hypothetical protein
MVSSTDYQISSDLGNFNMTQINRAEETLDGALRKMWIIIVSLTLTNFYVYIYS